MITQNLINFKNKGSAVLQAMAISGLVSLTAAGVMNHNVNVSKIPKMARIKDQMNEVKLSVMEAATTSFAYTNCSSVAGVASCNINLNYFDMSEQIVFGTACAAGPCGVRLRGPQGTPVPILDITDPNTPRFRAEVFYEGSDQGVDFNLAPLQVDMEIAKEVLQAASFICPMATPIFMGFDNQNRIICRALPANCPAGTYMSGFNAATLAPTCTSIVDADACPANQFLTSYTWPNNPATAATGTKPTRTCAPRIADPFAYFNFNPDDNVVATQPDAPPAMPDDPEIPPPPPECTAPGEAFYWAEGFVLGMVAGQGPACDSRERGPYQTRSACEQAAGSPGPAGSCTGEPYWNPCQCQGSAPITDPCTANPNLPQCQSCAANGTVIGQSGEICSQGFRETEQPNSSCCSGVAVTSCQGGMNGISQADIVCAAPSNQTSNLVYVCPSDTFYVRNNLVQTATQECGYATSCVRHLEGCSVQGSVVNSNCESGFYDFGWSCGPNPSRTPSIDSCTCEPYPY